MSNLPGDQSPVSRRHWLGIATTAAFGAGLIGSNAIARKAGVPDDKSNSMGTRVYNIRDFGARGDGQTLDTKAIQQAIDTCNKESGGTVLVPAGVFITGTVQLKSNVTLHLAAEAKLRGSGDGKQYYPAEAIPLKGDWTLNDGNTGLIFAVNASNIAIEGSGTIEGQGNLFRSTKGGPPPPAGISGNKRPHTLLFHQCKHLRINDVFLFESAYHCVRIIQCEYVHLKGIHIHSRVNHNNDGFHFISSKYVHITNCDVQCQDDACALFGSCQFVMVDSCSFTTRWSVFRFGGGVAENITVSNCLIYDTYGCPIKMRCEPGSRMENISFSNLVMRNVTGPVSIGLGPEDNPGIARNISFSNIQATVTVPVQLADVPFESRYNPGEIKSSIGLNGTASAPLENISFHNVHIIFPGGGTAQDAALRDVPQVAGEYYADGILPAYGIFARHTKNLQLTNVRLEVASPELRPAIVLDKTSDILLNSCSAQGDPDAASLLRFIETKDAYLSAMRVLTRSAVFLQVEGSGSEGILVDRGDLRKATQILAFANGATAAAAKWRE